MATGSCFGGADDLAAPMNLFARTADTLAGWLGPIAGGPLFGE
jgi:hypothetical protein